MLDYYVITPTARELRDWFRVRSNAYVGKAGDCNDNPISYYIDYKHNLPTTIYSGNIIAASGDLRGALLPNWAARFLQHIGHNHPFLTVLNGKQALESLIAARGLTSAQVADPCNFLINRCEYHPDCFNVKDIGKDENDIVLAHVERSVAFAFVDDAFNHQEGTTNVLL
jgi:hypothetical protein